MSPAAKFAEVFFWGWLFLCSPLVWLWAVGRGDALGYAFANAWLASLPGLYLLRLTLAVLFNWPLDAKRLRGHLFASRPVVVCLLAAWSATGVISANLVQLLSISPLGIIFVGIFVLFHSSAIWLIIFFPITFWRNSLALRTSGGGGIRGWWHKLWTDSLCPALKAAREIFEGLKEVIKNRKRRF